MVKVRDILPLIQWNDAQIIKDRMRKSVYSEMILWSEAYQKKF